jgi:hypothetical protein
MAEMIRLLLDPVGSGKHGDDELNGNREHQAGRRVPGWAASFQACLSTGNRGRIRRDEFVDSTGFDRWAAPSTCRCLLRASQHIVLAHRLESKAFSGSLGSGCGLRVRRSGSLQLLL